MIINENIKYYTIAEAASILNMTNIGLSALVRRGAVESLTIGGRKHISEDAIRDYSKKMEGSSNDGLQHHDA